MPSTLQRWRIAIVGAIAVVLLMTTGCTSDNDKTVRAANDALGVAVVTTQGDLSGDSTTLALKESTDKIDFGLAHPMGRVADISTMGGRLTGTAKIILDIPKGVKAEDATIYTYDETLKRPVLMGGELDGKKRTLTVTTNHFSKWWVSSLDPAALPTSFNAAAFVFRYLSEFTRAAPKTACDYPALSTTVIVKANTLPKGVEADVCAIYNKDNELTLDIGNSSGAPLLISPGPGLKLKSTTGSEVPLGGLVNTVREKLGDGRVTLGGARRIIFTVDPKHIAEKGEVHLSAKVDIGYAALAFSGALLELVSPVFKDTNSAGQALSAANKAVKYSECIDRRADVIAQRLDANELTAAELDQEVIRLHNTCQDEFSKMLIKAFQDTDKLNPRYRDSITLGFVRQLVKRIGMLLSLVGNAASLITQPIYTAHYAGNSNFVLRADINEPPALADRDNALPSGNDGPFLRDPKANKQLPAEVNGQVMDYRPTPGANCDKLEMKWNPDWLDKYYGRQTSLLADGKIQAATYLAVVPKDNRAAVARYFTLLREMKKCDTTVRETYEGTTYNIAYLKETFDSGIKWPGKYVVAYRELVGYANSEGDRIYQAYVYDNDRGYLFAITMMVTQGRDIEYTSNVEDKEFKAAIAAALTHMHTRLGQSLGMHKRSMKE